MVSDNPIGPPYEPVPQQHVHTFEPALLGSVPALSQAQFALQQAVISWGNKWTQDSVTNTASKYLTWLKENDV